MAKNSLAQNDFTNAEVAKLLDEIAGLLHLEGANPFRVAAYHKAAHTARHCSEPLAAIFERDGYNGLRQLPGVGESLARKIGDMLRHGKSKSLERLRRRQSSGDSLTSLPQIGPRLAQRIRATLGINSLEEVFIAANDGRLRRIAGLGGKRVQAIRDTLAVRLNIETPPEIHSTLSENIPVADLLEIDREYRQQAAEGRLLVVAPKRFNPDGKAWLPILHAERGGRRFSAHYSNTARSHERDRAHDWVAVYCIDKKDFGRWTVVTARQGPLRGERVVRGRERECQEHYAEPKLVQLSLPEVVAAPASLAVPPQGG